KLELMCYKVLMKEKRVTQTRYKLLCDSHEFFASQLEMLFLFRYSRHSIGIMASSRGLVAGCLMIQVSEQRSSGLFNLLEKMSIRSDARYIIVVEKDRIFNQIPSILILLKGYIDIATRFLLHRLSRAFPHFPIFALVDWCTILGTFKFGSIGMGLEAYKYACNVKWMGVRWNDLQLIPEESYVPLKPRDLQIAKSLMSCDMLQVNKKFMHPLGFIAYFKRRPCRC
ncbi:hypothetical protein MKX03_004846, partial [Papaver bracteatum]